MAEQKRRNKESPKSKRRNKNYAFQDTAPNERPCLNRDGTTKRAYVTSALAKQQARRVDRLSTTDSPHPVRAYHCPSCGLYHVGHDRKARE